MIPSTTNSIEQPQETAAENRPFLNFKGLNQRLSSFMIPSTTRLEFRRKKACGELDETIKNLCSFVVCSAVTKDFGLARKTTGYWDISTRVLWVV